MIFHKLTINRVILLIYIFAIIYFVTALITNDNVKLWISIVVGTSAYCYLIFAYWQKNRLVAYRGSCTVEMQKESVECRYENGKKFKMSWNDVRRVTATRMVDKNNQNHSETWLRLHSYPWRKVFSVPWRATNFDELYDKVSQWDNFDDGQIHEVHDAKQKTHLVLWEKED